MLYKIAFNAVARCPDEHFDVFLSRPDKINVYYLFIVRLDELKVTVIIRTLYERFRYEECAAIAGGDGRGRGAIVRHV